MRSTKSAALVSALLLAITVTLGLGAQAGQQIEAHISKTYSFPVSTLEAVEQAMADAYARKGKAMEQDVRYDIDTNQNLSVHCAAESPIMYQGHLYGCVLEAIIDLGNGVTATGRNMLYIQQSSAEVQDVLAKTDSSKSNRVDLKTIFDGGQGSSYYCTAGGSTGWNCFLNFID